MARYRQYAGAWKEAERYRKHNGVWKPVQARYRKEAGVWKETYSAGFDPDTPLGTFIEGGYYGGNIVDGGQTFALIFAPASAETSVIWGPFSTDPGTKSVTNGMANTLAMIADAANTYPSAEHCYDLVINGKDDWYLPAKDELNVGRANRLSMPAEGAFNLSGVYYWSSTDDGQFSAWRQQFSTGTQGGSSRGTAHNVRPVRRVLIPA